MFIFLEIDQSQRIFNRKFQHKLRSFRRMDHRDRLKTNNPIKALSIPINRYNGAFPVKDTEITWN